MVAMVTIIFKIPMRHSILNLIIWTSYMHYSTKLLKQFKVVPCVKNTKQTENGKGRHKEDRRAALISYRSLFFCLLNANY